MSFSPRSIPRSFADASQELWQRQNVTDYMASFASATAPTGWTYTGTPTVIANAADGDLFSISDHNPAGCQIATIASAQSMRFQSLVFGEREHMKAAENILGYAPTLLCFRAIARFSVNSANEDQTGFGFVNTTAATSTNGQKVCWVSSNATNFIVRSNTNTANNGAIDTNWHDWLFFLNGTTITPYRDGVLQNTVSMATDQFGCAFQVNGAASRTNVVQLSALHVWYQ